MAAAPFRRLLPWIRAQFPQLEALRGGERRVYLDNAAGTLLPQAVADAMADAALWANPQPDRAWPASPETKAMHHEVRSLLRAFLNAPPETPVFLSESTTASLYKLREALEPEWGPEDNVVVTDCDHFANISPWEWRARWQVRRAPMLPDGHLDLDRFANLLDEKTRVAAVTLASNGLGTLLRVPEAVRLVRERAPRAFVVVDAVHAAPHVPIDVRQLGADALAFSTYKLFGPFCGVLWLREGLLPALQPYRVEPHTDPETLLEWGTLNNVTAGGIRAALQYLEAVGEKLEPLMIGAWTGYERRERRFKLAVAVMQAYEAEISARVLRALPELPRVRLYGITDPAAAVERVPTFGFEIDGVPDTELEPRFWSAGRVQLAAGTHYSAAVLRGLGRASLGRASFAHYNDDADVEAFLSALGTVGGQE